MKSKSILRLGSLSGCEKQAGIIYFDEFPPKKKPGSFLAYELSQFDIFSAIEECLKWRKSILSDVAHCESVVLPIT